MSAKMVTGNEAIALGALRAGVKVVTGYPGTPSSEVITSLWRTKIFLRQMWNGVPMRKWPLK